MSLFLALEFVFDLLEPKKSWAKKTLMYFVLFELLDLLFSMMQYQQKQ